MASYTPTDAFKDTLIVPIKQIEPWQKGTLKSKSEVVAVETQRKVIENDLKIQKSQQLKSLKIAKNNHRSFLKLA